MELAELYEMQKALDARIIKEKGLEYQDLMPNTVLALLVELAEMSNEWRGFKHWSNDQEPRTKVPSTAWGEPYRNPLLEEYVDCVHFFLSIARQKDWLEHMYVYEEAIDETREKGLDGGIGGALHEVFYWLSKMQMETGRDEKIEAAFGHSKQEFCFSNAWYVFICIGLIGFGFTFEQIVNAYVEKNNANHKRQDSGY